MTSPSWYLSGTAPLNQLGATMGVGVMPQSQFNNPAYTQWLNDQAEEQRRQADQDYGLRKQALDEQYDISKMNAKSTSERNALDKWYQEQQVQLAQQRLAMEDRQFNQTFGENQRQFNTTTGVGLLGTLANLRGPANYYQASEYARGVSRMPETPTFLAALQNGAKLAGFGAQGGLPTPESYGTLAAKLGGDPTGGTGGPSQDNSLAAIGNIAAKGAGQLGAGALEQLTPTEQSLFTSGLDKLGIDTPTFLDQYRRSRISNGGSYRAA
jgi:hypothetical protein